jgi:SagB-type dehydrogenase family enzyme
MLEQYPLTAEGYERRLASRTFSAFSGNRGARSFDRARRPPRVCVVRNATSIPLPMGITHGDLRIDIRRETTQGRMSPGPISIAAIGDLLLLSAGVLRRKLSIQWGKEGSPDFTSSRARFSRGVASGGGLYPYCIYVISLSRSELPCGVYHYDVAQHALHRVRVGQFSAQVRKILGSSLERFDLLFVVVARFWQSAFKYGQFAYKVIMQDVGGVLGGMEQVALSLNWNTQELYWFADAQMEQLLGLDPSLAAPFVGLGVSRDGAVPKLQLARVSEPADDSDPLPRTEFTHVQSSLDNRSLESILKVHRSTVLHETEQLPEPVRVPAVTAYSRTRRTLQGGELIPALLRRETPWGQITDRHPGMDLEQLVSVLEFAICAGAHAADIYGGTPSSLPLLRADVFVRRVGGISAGLYRYDVQTSELLPERAWAADPFTERAYVGNHHNIEQVPAVLAVVGRLGEAVLRFGQRGVRIMNSEAGVFAHRTYLACAAWSLGCGAVLGFDAAALSVALGLDLAKDVPLLLILLGSRKVRASAFDFQLVCRLREPLS